MGRPTKSQSAERERQYRELYDDGLTCSAIAARVGVSVSAVAQWCRRNALPPHGEGNRPHALRPPPDPADDRRPIPSAPGYTASRSGRLYSERTDPPREMTARVHQGQWRVALSIGGRVRYRFVASLVLEAWGEPRPDGGRILFLDGDPLNAAASNLEWRQGAAHLDLAELVRVWQSSASVSEACERLAVSYPTVMSHVTRLRERGVPLKDMRPDADMDELTRIAAGEE
jgi:transposase